MGRTFRDIGVIIIIVTLALTVRKLDGDLQKDKEECVNQLVGLATCLPYVEGQAKAPTLDCCGGLKQVIKDSKKCLCLLVKDRNDPNIGIKINSSLALSLPRACHAGENIILSHCIDLLHLPHNSSDAKEFADIAKIIASPTAASNNGTSSDSHTGKVANDGRKSWVEASSTLVIMFYGSLMFLLTMA